MRPPAARSGRASQPPVQSTNENPEASAFASLQRLAGNQAVAALVQRDPPATAAAPTSLWDLAAQIHLLVSPEQQARLLESRGRTREALALRSLDAYGALHASGGPLGDDPTFGFRLYLATLSIGRQFFKAPSFDDLPAGQKALIYAIEKLNLSSIKTGTVDPTDQAWMTTHEGTTGGKNVAVGGSTGTYGPSSWKCNKLVADSYLAKEGGSIGKENYPMYGSGKERKWGYKASDLAATVSGGKLKLEPGKDLKHFPYSELVHLSSDGSSIVEIDEFDPKGERVARYILSGGMFEKHVPDGKGGWTKTKETRDPSELKPGEMAEAGDIVAFHSAEKGVSGHTGLSLGHDLFISAMNATEGVGILSVSRHIDPATWDRYDFVGYRRFK
jgi:hypothetical protein